MTIDVLGEDIDDHSEMKGEFLYFFFAFWYATVL